MFGKCLAIPWPVGTAGKDLPVLVSKDFFSFLCILRHDNIKGRKEVPRSGLMLSLSWKGKAACKWRLDVR